MVREEAPKVAMEEFYNALLGPAATIGSGMYARTAMIKYMASEPMYRVAAMALAAFTLAWMAFFRGLAALNYITLDHMRSFTLPMGIAVYGLHFYMAFTLALHAKERGMVRRELEKLRLETRAWGQQGGNWDGRERRKTPREE